MMSEILSVTTGFFLCAVAFARSAHYTNSSAAETGDSRFCLSLCGHVRSFHVKEPHRNVFENHIVGTMDIY